MKRTIILFSIILFSFIQVANSLEYIDIPWSQEKMDGKVLKVYIEPGSYTSTQNAVESAVFKLNALMKGNKICLSYEFEKDPRYADIIVNFLEDETKEFEVNDAFITVNFSRLQGITLLEFNDEDIFVSKAEIYLPAMPFVESPSGMVEAPKELKIALSMHHLIRAAGLKSYSNDKNDVLYKDLIIEKYDHELARVKRNPFVLQNPNPKKITYQRLHDLWLCPGEKKVRLIRKDELPEEGTIYIDTKDEKEVSEENKKPVKPVRPYINQEQENPKIEEEPKKDSETKEEKTETKKDIEIKEAMSSPEPINYKNENLRFILVPEIGFSIYPEDYSAVFNPVTPEMYTTIVEDLGLTNELEDKQIVLGESENSVVFGGGVGMEYRKLVQFYGFLQYESLQFSYNVKNTLSTPEDQYAASVNYEGSRVTIGGKLDLIADIAERLRVSAGIGYAFRSFSGDKMDLEYEAIKHDFDTSEYENDDSNFLVSAGLGYIIDDNAVLSFKSNIFFENYEYYTTFDASDNSKADESFKQIQLLLSFIMRF